MLGQHRRCVICRRPATSTVMQRSVCGAPACRHGLLNLARRDCCSICGVGLLPAERARGVCDDTVCFSKDAAQRAEKKRQERLRRAQQLITRYVGEYSERQGLNPEEVLAAVVPANDLPMVSRTPDRTARLREHVAGHVEEAARLLAAGEAPPLEDVATSDVHHRSLHVCAACLGGCCTQGADRAYITPATLARYAEVSGTPVASLPDIYAARVPAEGYETSCIFHGPRGCGLDREMRSDTCNQHLCGGLRRLRGRMGGRTADPIVVVGSSDAEVIRVVEIDGVES
jgi:hypothetical protein